MTGSNPSPPLRLDHPQGLDLGPPTKGAKPTQSGISAIPTPGIAPPSSPGTLKGTGTAPARAVLFPAVRYKFDDLKAITISTPEIDVTLRLIGEISLQRKGTMSEWELSQRGTLTGKLRADYDSKFANLIGQVKVGLNSQTHAAQVSCNLAVAAKMDGKVSQSPSMSSLHRIVSSTGTNRLQFKAR